MAAVVLLMSIDFKAVTDQQFCVGMPMELLLCPGSANVCRSRMCAGRQAEADK